MENRGDDDVSRFATTRTQFPANSKDLSTLQKKSVIQSVLNSVPRELPPAWNESPHRKPERKKKKSRSFVKITPAVATAAVLPPSSPTNELGDATKATTNATDSLPRPSIKNVSGVLTEVAGDTSTAIFQSGKHEQFVPKEPPLGDPFSKSISYYEKHQVLNHFQHMTAKLVLHRPENALDYMIDWCQKMQVRVNKEKFATKTLFENGETDPYGEEPSEEEVGEVIEQLTEEQIDDSTPIEKLRQQGATPEERKQDIISIPTQSPVTSSLNLDLIPANDTAQSENTSRSNSVSQVDQVSIGPEKNAVASEKTTPNVLRLRDEESDSDSLDLSSASSVEE